MQTKTLFFLYFFLRFLILILFLFVPLQAVSHCKVSMNDKISHTGIVERIAEGCVTVRILQASACAACKVAGHCSAAETKEKLVDVSCNDDAAYSQGQTVMVTASHDVAFRALLLGFGLPLVLMVMVLVLVLSMSGDEAVAALGGLGILAPYYLLLWLMRSRIGRSVSFHIEQI